MAGARYAHVLQHLVVHLPEQIEIDVVGLEGVGILGKTNCFQPLVDRAHIASCSSNPLASFRSSVSKPSVNQP
jgi:hypothetical protein